MPPPLLHIRPAVDGDAETVFALIDALNREDDQPPGFTRDEALRLVTGQTPVCTVLIAERQGNAVGIATAHLTYDSGRGETGVFLTDLYVIPTARRQGVARALIQAIGQAFRAKGARFLSWTAEPGNAGAAATYAAIGSTSAPLISHTLPLD